jgi:DNA-binding CsgD family transcriptional regulator
VGEHEVNVTALAQGRGRPIGQLLQPDKRYFRSNTYNLLVRASGHHHCLDMRVDHDGQARVVVLAFRTQACPAFSDESARTLQRVGPYLQRALLQAQSPLSWMVREQKQGFLVADTDGRRITLVDPTAQTLLAHLGLRDTAMAAKQGVHAVPTFVSHLCQTLASASQVQDDIQAQLPCAGGALLVRASRLMAPGQHQHTQTLIELRKVVPDQLALARRVISLRLSPLQRQIVMRAAQGLERATCQQALGVSSEALKKHLRQVYAETGTRDWPSLTQAMAGGSP